MLPKLCLLALALRRAEEKAKDLPWLPYNHSTPYADEYEAMARGVLEAMRVPDEGMVEAMGCSVVAAEYAQAAAPDCLTIWQAGIDAILAEYDDYMRRDIHGNQRP